ncbi:hypothetical protein AB0F71_34820 [Kitasatospora sp. NPDC028055]|uniref:hypothetical protein n=1 Tax=Kitasatospora sp. NPDC028055 TaxID=3155653 RepID=UPI0033CAF18B
MDMDTHRNPPTAAALSAAPTHRPPARWAVRAAHVAALTAVPSGVWRIAMGVGVPVGFDTTGLDIPGWFSAVCIAMSLGAEGLTLLTLGLVQPWGEVVPRWLPLIGGRRVAPLAAVVPALLGAAVVMLLTIPRAGGFGGAPGAPTGPALLLMDACYAPLLLWGPLLLLVTVAYYRRRRA